MGAELKGQSSIYDSVSRAIKVGSFLYASKEMNYY